MMSKPYKLLKKDNLFSIVEVETDQVVYKDKDQNNSKIILKRLNFGYGFCGFTPGFFLKEYK